MMISAWGLGFSTTTPKGVIDGWSGFNRCAESFAARSKLQDEHLVKKLSPHFHWGRVSHIAFNKMEHAYDS
jgi:hypothetical protein